MSFTRRSPVGSHRLFGSFESSRGGKLGRSLGRDARRRSLRIEPLEDRSLLSVGVGGMVWNDLNSDGVRGLDEPGVAGAVAEVFSTTDEVIGGTDDVSLGVAITDPAGQYSFTDLPDSPNFYVVFRTPVGYEFTAQDAGGDDALDSDADAVGKTGLFTVAPDTTATDIDAGLAGASPDFGWALNAGAANEKSWGVTVTTDEAGNVYVAGYFGNTADFDSGPGVYNLTSSDARDIIVAKYSATGALVWAQSIAGEGLEDVVGGIAVDAQGSVYMAGSFEGTADFDPGVGVANLTSAGDTDAFICKLDSAGNYLWVAQFGGAQADDATGIALGPGGAVHTTGRFFGTVDFDPGPNEHLLAQNNSGTIYIVKLNSVGEFVWAGSIGAYSNGIAVADDGSVYTTGSFGGTADFDPGPAEFLLSYNHSSGYGIVDSAAFLCKWDSDGNFVWANQWSLTDSTSGKAIDVAPDGSIYVTGTKQSSLQFGSVINPDNDSNLYVVKFDAAGNNVWTVVTTNIYQMHGIFGSPYGGSAYGEAIAVDADGNAFITGTFFGSPDFDPSTGQFHLDGSLYSSYLLKLDSAGNFVWVKPVDAEWIRPAVGPDGSVYLTGILSGLLSDSSDGDPGPGEYTITSISGDRDILLSRILSFSGPTDISLSTNNVHEWQPAGTVVGNFATNDDEPGATFTYTLVAGEGGDDNAAFAIVGDELQTAAIFNAAEKDYYLIRVRSTDYAGQYVEKELVIYVLDITPPVMTLTAPIITNDATPEIVVEADEGETAYLDVDLNNDGDFDDAGELGYTTATLAGGTATFQVSPALEDATYQLRARAFDHASNEYFSSVVETTVDTVAPDMTLMPPAYASYHQSIAKAYAAEFVSGKQVNVPDGTPIYLDVDLNDDGDYDDEGEFGALVSTTIDGWADFDVAALLHEGYYWLGLQARIYDLAGNERISRGATMVDTIPPEVLLTAPAIINSGSPVVSVSITDDESLTFTKTIQLDVDLNNDGDFDDDEFSYTKATLVNGTAAFNVSPELADGTYRLRARVADAAGNEGVSDVIELVIDTIPPSVTLLAPAITNDSTPEVTITSDGTIVYLDIDLNNDGDFLDTGEIAYTSATIVGGVAVFEISPELTDGTYNLQARASDEATNIGYSDIVAMVVDATPPVVELTAPVFTNDATPEVVVAVDLADGKTVYLDVDLNNDGYFDDGETGFAFAALSGGAAVFDIASGLVDGTYSLRARAFDAAGNEGIGTATMVVDLTAPTITISVPSALVSQGYPVSYTVTYNDLYLHDSFLTAGDIGLVSGTVDTADGTVAVTRLAVDTWLVTIDNITGEGRMCIGIASGTAVDLAGNLAPDVLLSEFFDVEYVGPIDLSLSNQEILEHLPAGTAVGAFSTVDTDRNSFTYSLVEGEGDDDNASFTIDGGQLLASGTFDYAAQSTYAIRVRTTDSKNNSLEKTFTIAIIDTTNFSGLVWNDADGDGLRGADESFLRGIPVELFSSTDDAIGNNDDVLLCAATTDADGRYAFNDLQTGLNYYVVFRAPVGYEFTLRDAGGDDALDSDADATGTSALLSVDAGENDIVIDAGLTGASPEFGWALNAGAADEEAAAEAVVVDDLGNAYIAGFFSGTVDFDPGPGAFTLTSAGEADVFVAKYSADGALVWAKSFGGAETDKAFDIAPADDGSLFVAGYFYGTADFDPGADTFALTSAGLNDAFAMKLDADGNLVWATSMGGEGAELAHAIALAPDGSVQAAGYCTTPGEYSSVGLDPNTDILIFKLDANGNSVWNNAIGSDGSNEAAGIAVDDEGNVFVAGYFSGTVDFDPGEDAYNLTVGEGSLNNQDGFVLKLDPDGDFVWAVGLDGNDVDILKDIAVAPDGSVYAAGSATGSIQWEVIPFPIGFPTQQFFPITIIGGPGGGCILGSFGSISSDYPFLGLSGFDTLAASEADLGEPIMSFSTYGVTSEANSLDLGARTGGILVKLDSAGNLVWCEETGSTKSETTGISLGDDGNIYTAGTLENIAYFDNTGSNDFALDGADGSGFVSIFNSDGEFVRAFTTGSPENVSASDLAVAADGAVYVAGLFSNTADFDPGANTYNLESTGDADFFLSKHLAFAGPADLSISNNSVGEGLPAGTIVGDFSTVGELPGAIYSYTLVSGEGGDDNESFVIVEGRLQTAAVFDISEKSSYTVRVRSTDNTGLYFEEAFEIAVVDATPPVVALAAPALVNTGSPEVTATAMDGDIPMPDGTTIYLDVDLNNDGDFDDDGEMGYTTATLAEGTAAFNVSPELADGTYRLRARVADSAKNEGFSNVATMIVDTTIPSIFISGPSATTTQGSSVTYSVECVDANLDPSSFTAGDIILNRTGTANGTVTIDGGTGSLSDRTWTVTISDITGEGTLSISIGDDSVFDLAGNSAAAVGPAAPFTVNPVFTDLGSLGIAAGMNGSLEWGDYDNDGRLDLLLVNGDLRVYHNDGNNVFHDIGLSYPPQGFSQGAWGDYDNDGRLDFAVSGRNGETSSTVLYHNDGNGGFSEVQTGLPGASQGSVAWGDYDNDGRLDILLTGTDGSKAVTRLFHNDGNNAFHEVPTALPGVLMGTAVWGDYDNDGRLDVLIVGANDTGHASERIARVYHNDGNGEFHDIQAGLPGFQYGSADCAAWGDYDNDGRLDLLLCGSGLNEFVASVYHNDGNGVFHDISAGLVGVCDSSVAWGDYDNDGRLDILWAGDDGSQMFAVVYHNDGDDSFHDIKAGLTGVAWGSVAWGDFDGDGQLDAILAGYNGSGDSTTLYHNDTAVADTAPAAPTGLTATEVSTTSVILSWNASSDAETASTGLTYSIRVGTTPGGCDVVCCMTDADGLRQLAQRGMIQGTSWTLNGLTANQRYYWSVQAVDTTLVGSVFAAEGTFIIDTAAPTVVLTSPSYTSDNTPSIHATVADAGSGVADGTTVYLDVDLNNDGDFDDDGEMGYTTATLAEGTAAFNVSPELAEGTYRLRARVADAAGNEGASNPAEMNVVAALPLVNCVVVTEAGTTPFKNGIVESNDKMLITWAVQGADAKPAVQIKVDGQRVKAVFGPYMAKNGAYMYAATFGPLEAGSHSFTIDSLVAGDAATYSDTFDLTAPAIAGPAVSSVFVVEAGKGSDRDGAKESTDRLLVTWREISSEQIVSRTLKIDGRKIGAVGGPNAEDCCYGVFGPLEAGEHGYSIEVTDADGVSAAQTGTFNVASPADAGPAVTSVFVVEAGKGSDRDGSKESTDRLLVTWREISSEQIVSRTLKIDGRKISAVGGPNADGCCYGLFGPLEAGEHGYEIKVTDAAGKTATAAGAFQVVAAAALKSSVASFVASSDALADAGLLDALLAPAGTIRTDAADAVFADLGQ